MGKLTEKYSGLAEMLTDTEVEETFKAKALAAGANATTLNNLQMTLRNIDHNKAEVPTRPEFKRVMVGKLTVPISFLRHVELLAKFANVSEEAVWQLLMIETCQMYAERYASVVEALNTVVLDDRV